MRRDAILALVPHQGAMCLLDRVESWTADLILCHATSHRAPDHPLRRDGLLPAVCGVEYALQAMALHGALSGDAEGGARASRPGYLASLRGLDLAVDRLDDIAGDLAIEAVALAREARGFTYAFSIAGGGRTLLSGQATVILPPEAGA